MTEHEAKQRINERSIQLLDGSVVRIRPLKSSDKASLVNFLSGLSVKTRYFYVLDNYGEKTADNLCSSLGKPGKMHFVVENDSSEIVALTKFSLDFPDVDKSRYLQHGIQFSTGTVSRCGTCIADNYQNLGLGGIILQEIIDVSQSLGQKTIILSGGIFANNFRAIHMCQKFGFIIAGSFTDLNGQEHVDMYRYV